MKLLKRTLITCLLTLAIFIPNTILGHAEEAFTYTKYHVDINVLESGVFQVTENVVANFHTRRHGLFFNIPTKYNMKFDGNSYRYNFPIKNIKVLKGRLHEINTNDYSKEIVIGDPDTTVIGEQNYIISYDVNTYDLGLTTGNDLFYYNLLGKTLTSVDNFTFKITFPKAIDESKIKFYFMDNNDDGITYTYKDNVIEGSYHKTITAGNSATIFVNLGKGYFNFPNYHQFTNYFTIFYIAFMILMIIRFLFKGRDGKIIQSVELKAPDNLNSAECAYVLNGHNTQAGMISLVFELIKKKHLKIKEEDNELFYAVTTSDETLNASEQKIYSGLSGNEFDVYRSFDDIEDLKFYNSYCAAQKKVANKFTGFRKLFNSTANVKLGIFVIINILIITSWLTLTNYLFYGEVIALVIIAIACGLAGIILALFAIIMKTKKKYILMMVVYIAISGVLILLSYLLQSYYISFEELRSIIIIFAITMLFIGISYRHSDYYINIIGKIYGLREFIKVTEEDRLRELVKEYPNLFYDILPYAYAFGLTKVWAKHFENLTINPNEYVMINDYNNYHYYHRIGNYTERSYESGSTIYARNNAASGGGSSGGFGGGGFSGGSSGGGFGGSSSGSW
ncbi:MAG: DUF2207 domain-containing protein [Erysipelotrichaceae bacterium]|nr:DUF2207 domain-containing protein [Erysipelotrichaceae bacterium]